MAKETTDKDKSFLKGEIGQVEPRDINAEMQESYLDYAMSVIVARALPDVRDGLKPVHRRILFAMDNVGLKPGSKYKKSANVVGEVLGKYHPHGDQAVYDSMVRMAQDFAMRYPLVDGQGNFGSIDGDNAAAMRYTEARMAKISEEILSDIDKETVDFVPNYDGTLEEPVVLPSRIPNLLLNGSEGIAVGMATKIPPHNLSEVIDGLVALIDNPEITVEELKKYIKGPDFPTGGVIFDNGEIKAAYGTGRGGIVMRAVANIEEAKKGRFQIIVSEIPYQVNKASLIEKISELVKDKKIIGISDIRDESDRKNPVRIVIDLKKDAYPNKILNQLYKLTPMQCKFHVNMIALVDRINPRLLTLKMVLEEFVKHREEVVRRRSEYELKKAKERAHVLEGLLKALDHIDEVIATIKKSKDQDTAKINLMKKFKLTEIQALAILAMQLRTLAGLERKKIKDEYEELKKKIKYLTELLASRKKMLGLIKKELLEVKDKYGDARRTKIIKKAVGEFTEEDLVPNEQTVIILTEGNYIKRVLSSAYRSQGRGGKGVLGMATKEEDVIKAMAEANNHDYVLFFTNQGRVFQTKAYEIPQASRTAKGSPIVNVLQLAPEEYVTTFLVIPDINQDGYLVMATKNGIVKKTEIKSFSNIRKSGIIAIKLKKNDELAWVRPTSGSDDIMIVTQQSQAIRFSEKEIRPMGRGASGVRGIRLRKGDVVIGMDSATNSDEMVVVMEKGYGKRTDVKNFTKHHRGGMGTRAGVVTAKTGKTVDMQIIDSLDDDLVVISTKGTVIRTPLKNISKMGRATQGVRIMRLDEDDSVASVSSIPKKKNVQKELDLKEKPSLKSSKSSATKSKKKQPKAKPKPKKSSDKNLKARAASKPRKSKTVKATRAKTTSASRKKSIAKKGTAKAKPKRSSSNVSSKKDGFKVRKIESGKKNSSKKAQSNFRVKKIK